MRAQIAFMKSVKVSSDGRPIMHAAIGIAAQQVCCYSNRGDRLSPEEFANIDDFDFVRKLTKAWEEVGGLDFMQRSGGDSLEEAYETQ